MTYLGFASQQLAGGVAGKGTELVHGSSLYYSIHFYTGLNFSIVIF